MEVNMAYEVYVDFRITYHKKYDELCLALGIKFDEFFDKKATEICGYEFQFYSGTPGLCGLYGSSYGGIKWDTEEYKKCFIELSEMFTACRIQVNIKGDDKDDFREIIVKDGLFCESVGYVSYWTTYTDKVELEKIEKSSAEPRGAIFFT